MKGGPTHYVVLATGDGSLMNSDLPEVLHPVADVPMLCLVIKAVQAVQHAGITVVVSPDSHAAVLQVLQGAFPDMKLEFVVQESAKDSIADAQRLAVQTLPNSANAMMLVAGNLPLLTPQTLEQAALEGARKAAGIVYFGSGEQPTDGARQGLQWAAVEFLRKGLSKTGGKEAAANGRMESFIIRSLDDISCEPCCQIEELQPVNSRQGLADAEDVLRRRLIKRHQAGGVTFRDPQNTFVGAGVSIGRDSVIGIGVQLSGKTTIGKCVRVEGPSVVKDARIGDGARIGAFSHVEAATMAPSAGIGPFARLRVGADVAAGAYVGNFCEVKNARVGPRTNVCHLSYLGDAELGEDVNIGAGTITCNFNGIAKNRTTVGSNAFIGSATTLVAPVAVGEGALVAAGSVITEDVPSDGLALGRARQTTKEARADATRAKLREREASKPGGGSGH